MKFKVPIRYDVKRAMIDKWHSWFAWYPVRVGITEFCWLERVERKRNSDWFGDYWEYRAKLEP